VLSPSTNPSPSAVGWDETKWNPSVGVECKKWSLLMTIHSDNSAKVIVEQQVDGAVVVQPKDRAHEQWQARLQEILGKFEGMPEEIERDRTPPRDPPNFD
jgi:hypothetical protein